MIKKKLNKKTFNTNNNITKARPSDTSEPAIVNMYIEKICPKALSNIEEKSKKLRLQANKITSKNNRIIIIFLLLIKIP